MESQWRPGVVSSFHGWVSFVDGRYRDRVVPEEGGFLRSCDVVILDGLWMV